MRAMNIGTGLLLLAVGMQAGCERCQGMSETVTVEIYVADDNDTSITDATVTIDGKACACAPLDACSYYVCDFDRSESPVFDLEVSASGFVTHEEGLDVPVGADNLCPFTTELQVYEVQLAQG